MQKPDTVILTMLSLALAVGGCATIANSKDNLIFMQLPGAACGDPQARFTVDGVQTPCEVREFSREEISRAHRGNYDEVTYSVTSMPSLRFSSGTQYHTVRLVSPTTGDHQGLVKRDLIESYRWYLYFDTFFTAGLGSVLDIYGNHLWGYSLADLQTETAPVAVGAAGGAL